MCLAIFDPLYRYDYFARTAVLEPNTADGGFKPNAFQRFQWAYYAVDPH